MTNYFRKYKSLHSTTLSTSISTGTSETITFASVSNVPTDTEVTVTIDRVDSAGTATATKMERITGTISGSNLTSYTRGVDYSTEQAHSAGAVVEMVWNAADWNQAVDGLLIEHNQTGTHKTAAVTTLKATGAEVTTGTEDGKIVTPKALADAGISTTASSTTTFTNKRITKRVGTSVSAATHTINSDSYDAYTVTAQAEAVTFAAPTGTPTQGQTLIIRLKDDGTARGITWNGIFRDGDVALPSTTVISQTMYLGFMYNSTDTKWDLLALIDNVS